MSSVVVFPRMVQETVAAAPVTAALGYLGLRRVPGRAIAKRNHETHDLPLMEVKAAPHERPHHKGPALDLT